MLIEFTVGNYLSFKDKQALSFRAESSAGHEDNSSIVNGIKILKTAVIYGANSSGKSNLIKAMKQMRTLVLESVKLNDYEELNHTPFLLSEGYELKPTHFEVEFFLSDIQVRYGFEYIDTKIISEWLFTVEESGDEIALFTRTEEGIGVSNAFEEGKGKEQATNDNRLFISLVAQLGGELSKRILNWFVIFNTLSGVEHEDYKEYSLEMLYKKWIGSNESLLFFQKMKLGFTAVDVQEKSVAQFNLYPDSSHNLVGKVNLSNVAKKELAMTTIHNKYDENGEIIGSVHFKKDRHESEGTKKLIDLSGPLFTILQRGGIIAVDELDAKLHPLITIELIKLFNSPESNPNNAQLFFATHDTNLLSTDLFRPDQIWFAEKDRLEQTELYAMSEFKLPEGFASHDGSSIEKNYIRGRYGAIPFITR